MMASKKIIGILAEYDTTQGIYHACEKTRDEGFKRFDSFTPFPVHGLDKAMGLKPSLLPWMVLVAGITGGSLALLFMVWTSAYDYPLNIGGKPTFSIPAFIPIMFECTILFSALTAVFGMFFLNRLPKYYDPLFDVVKFSRVTNDRFFLVIGAHDHKFDEEKVKEFLNSTHPLSLTVVLG